MNHDFEEWLKRELYCAGKNRSIRLEVLKEVYKQYFKHDCSWRSLEDEVEE